MLSRGCVKKHICPVSSSAVCFKDRFKNHLQMQIKTDYAVYIVCFCLRNIGYGLSTVCGHQFLFPSACLTIVFSMPYGIEQSAACCSCCKVLHILVCTRQSYGSTLQCVAVCCSVLQCVAVRCRALQGGECRLSDEGSQWKCCHESGATSTSRRGDCVVCWKIYREVHPVAICSLKIA